MSPVRYNSADRNTTTTLLLRCTYLQKLTRPACLAVGSTCSSASWRRENTGRHQVCCLWLNYFSSNQVKKWDYGRKTGKCIVITLSSNNLIKNMLQAKKSLAIHNI